MPPWPTPTTTQTGRAASGAALQLARSYRDGAAQAPAAVHAAATEREESKRRNMAESPASSFDHATITKHGLISKHTEGTRTRLQQHVLQLLHLHACHREGNPANGLNHLPVNHVAIGPPRRRGAHVVV
eukprot:1418508-Prymnesium_polylepis.1